MRVGLLAGAAVAALLAVAIASGLGRGVRALGRGKRIADGEPVERAGYADTGGEHGGACAAGDVVSTAEPWGGAAGGRGTVVTVTLADGAAACDVATGPRGRMVDGSGRSSSFRMSPSRARRVSSRARASTVGVEWSNWCQIGACRPARPRAQLDGSSWMPVAVSGGADPVPPCIGTDPTSLSVTELQAAQ